MTDESGFRRGASAELAVVRAAADKATRATALAQLGGEDERILHQTVGVEASLTGTDNDYGRRHGQLVITSERVLFWSNAVEHGDDDMIIGATCIDLHALSEESALYLQITDEDAERGPLEWTLLPINDRQETAQTLFEAVCELVSLHPIDPNETDDMMMMMGGDNGDDEMVWAPPLVGDGEATPAEREAMLQRLDLLLVVPPELAHHDDHEDEEQEGQFDDAQDDIL